MVRPEALPDLLADPYRVACPRGHTLLDPAETTATAYCRVCERAYRSEALVDKRRATPAAERDG